MNSSPNFILPGFACMFGAHELKDVMKKNEETQVVEKYILPHLDRCL